MTLQIISNIWALSCREQADYWHTAVNESFDEDEKDNALALFNLWSQFASRYGDDCVLPDLAEVEVKQSDAA